MSRAEVEPKWGREVPGLDEFDMEGFVALEVVLEVNAMTTSVGCVYPGV